jgi:hypothetical protein
MVGGLWTERKGKSWPRWMKIGVFGLFKTVASFPVVRVALLLRLVGFGILMHGPWVARCPWQLNP